MMDLEKEIVIFSVVFVEIIGVGQFRRFRRFALIGGELLGEVWTGGGQWVGNCRKNTESIYQWSWRSIRGEVGFSDRILL